MVVIQKTTGWGGGAQLPVTPPQSIQRLDLGTDTHVHVHITLNHKKAVLARMWTKGNPDAPVVANYPTAMQIHMKVPLKAINRSTM